MNLPSFLFKFHSSRFSDIQSFPIIFSCLLCFDPFYLYLRAWPETFSFLFSLFIFFRNYTVSSPSEAWYASIAFFLSRPLLLPTTTHTIPTLINSAVSNSFTRRTLPSLLGHFPFYFYPRHRRIIVRSSPFLLFRRWRFTLVWPCCNFSLSLSLSIYRFSPLCSYVMSSFSPQPGSKLPFLGVCIDFVVTPPVSPTQVSQLGTFLLLERGKVKSPWCFFRWSPLAGRIFQRFLLVPRFFFSSFNTS